MRSPIQWFGGKGRMVAKLRGYLAAPHHIYVEVFGGGASLLFDRAPAPVEVYNDIDGRLAGLFRVLRDERLFAAFQRIVEAMPCSRRELEASHCLARCPAVDEVTRAAAFFVVCRQSFGGLVNQVSWGATVASVSGGQAQSTAAWANTIRGLPEVHERLRRVQVECQDWRKLIPHYDRPETLFYIDPPYLAETRRAGSYAHEMTADDHRVLLERLLAIEGMAFVSGYPSELYDGLLAGWRRDTFRTVCSAAGNTRTQGNLGPGGSSGERFRRTEVVWCNPRLAAALAKPRR